MQSVDFQPNVQLVEMATIHASADAVVGTRIPPPTIDVFREEYRADCLRIVSENYDRTMAINLDRELCEVFSNSSIPPRFLVLKQADEVCGFGCYTISWMQYGVFEISWINVDGCHRGKGFGTFLVSRILEELRMKQAHTVLLFASKAAPLYERLGFVKLTECGGDWLMAHKTGEPVHSFLA